MAKSGQIMAHRPQAAHSPFSTTFGSRCPLAFISSPMASVFRAQISTQ